MKARACMKLPRITLTTWIYNLKIFNCNNYCWEIGTKLIKYNNLLFRETKRKWRAKEQ